MSDFETAVVVPARYGSTRFPGKPLAMVAGTSMIERVWRIAAAATSEQAVFVATDDDRIEQHVSAFGGQVVRTPESCRNGTERVASALGAISGAWSHVVNLQGDAVLTPPWILRAVVDAAAQELDLPLVTPAVRMSRPAYEALVAAKAAGQVGGTTVVVDRTGDALYFSKSVIPFVREPIEPLPVFRHIGLYLYRVDALRQLLSWAPGPLEQSEKLEQLRALENGMPIRVVEVDYRGRTHMAIDSPEDLAAVEALIAAEGELL